MTEVEEAIYRLKKLHNSATYFHFTEDGCEWLDKDKNVIAEYKNGRMIRYESTIEGIKKS